MRNLFWAKSSAVHSDDCDEIVKKYSNNLDTALVGVGKLHDARKSQIKFIYDQPLIDLVKYWAFAFNKEAWAFDLYYMNPDVQFTEYDSSYLGEYKYHVDTLFDKDTLFERKLSVIIQLTDPNNYEGGDFSIRTSDNKDRVITQEYPELKNKGSVITFPSFFEHKITKVTKGTRNSLVSWIDGPQWR